MVFGCDIFVCFGELVGAERFGEVICELLRLSLLHCIGCPMIPVVFFFVAAIAPTPACCVRYGSGFWPIDHAFDVECRPIANIAHIDFWLFTPIQFTLTSLVYWNFLCEGGDLKYHYNRTCLEEACPKTLLRKN